LKVAQIDAGKVILNRTIIDIAALIDEVITEQQAQITAHQQRIEYQGPKPPAPVYVDAVLIRMVLENLLDNASKYMSEGGVITVTVVPNKGNTVISIADEGVGMNDQDISKLFQKFIRLPNELSIKVGGNGLGLYWVKKVIDLHKAEITVSSVLGSGTTFTITLPQDESNAKDTSR
jgi:signal transduction histidine kinase